MTTPVTFVLVAFGATIVRVAAARRWNRSDWPIGTLLVNVAGAFLLGLVHDSTGTEITLIGVAGLGSLTTFSTVAGETIDLTAGPQPRRAAAYVATTFVAGIAAAAAGLALA